MTATRFAAAALGLALLAAPGAASAQYFMDGYGGLAAGENIQGFTVTGKGSVAARPNLVEVDLEVSSSSELTADAIVKYRDARKRLREAFAALKLANVELDERGLLVDQKGMATPYYFGGFQPNTRNKTEVQLTRKLVVKGTDLRKLDEEAVLQLVAKLLDVAQDAGARVGSQHQFNPYYYNPYDRQNTGLVRFVLDDFDKLQDQAYEKAIADARTRAQRLARLSRVELGPVVGVRELMVPGERPHNMSDEEAPRRRLEVSRFQEIPVRVELLVRFDVRPVSAPREQAQGGDR